MQSSRTQVLAKSRVGLQGAGMTLTRMYNPLPLVLTLPTLILNTPHVVDPIRGGWEGLILGLL